VAGTADAVRVDVGRVGSEERVMAEATESKKAGFGFEEGVFLVTAALLVVSVVLVWFELKRYGAGPLGG
jgi:hypothetical protein